MKLTLLKLASITFALVAYSLPGLAQDGPPALLMVEFGNNVLYNQDTSDVSKFATDPGKTTAAPSKNFVSVVSLADIVAVNGRPAKGVFFKERRIISLTPSPNPGQAIADLTRNSAEFYDAIEILQQDGTPVGSIFISGFGGGNPTPGAPLAQTLSNYAIIGGTGAYLGAKGEGGEAQLPGGSAGRQASISEDPSNRRNYDGGHNRWVLHLIPMFRPQIVTTPSGPAVTHSSDFSLVTASKPAAAGEILSLFATGLGPTRPGVDPGQPFPSSPPAAVNSPVEVTVNGKAAEVLGAVGFPGAVDGYQVNIRMPSDAAKGAATLQVSAAWIVGTPVSIAVQ
jgi:uncharacterized protein (TIGR03437 family)